MPTKDFEMDKMEADFRHTINEVTAARRRMAEIEKKRQEGLEYVKNWHRELRREKAWDRLYFAFVLVMLMCGLFGAYRHGAIPLSVTIPAEVVCVSLTLVCLGDAIHLFRGSKRK